jgi:ADP-ribosylglycohydrolase
MASGFYGLRSTRPFPETLNDLIRHGGDADTNGAVCGTMYGARYGYQALPTKWLQAMPYKKWLDEKILRLLNHMDLSKQVS